MHAFDRVRHGILAVLVAVVWAAVTALPASAQTKSALGDATALPQPLTQESVRELVSRLSDEEVRQLLIEQLDRAAIAPAKATDDMGMSGMVELRAATARERLAEIHTALLALPDTLRDVIGKLQAPDGPAIFLLIGVLVAAMLAAGWLAERVYVYALRNYRKALVPGPAETFTAGAFRLGVGLLLDLVGIAVFALGALACFVALWQGHELRRIAVLEVLIAIVTVRVAGLLGEFLLSGSAGTQRLLPFGDAPARHLRSFAVLFAAFWGVRGFLDSVLRVGGASIATQDLLVIVVTTLGLAILLWAVWQVRAPIAGLIRGAGKHSLVASWLADLWPVFATAFFLTIAAARIYQALLGMPIESRAAILSVLVVVALPLIDMLLSRALAAAAGPTASGFVAAYEGVFRRGIHILVTVAGLLLIAHLWDVNLFALAQAGLGAQLSSSLVGIGIVLLLAHLLWEIAKAAIDRRLQAEGDHSADVPASRLRTLLPLFRAVILVTIIVMATMSVLAALGVDILPLLAGASVVGVAVGFGSQTLVRDVVSGAFFLMDDAFRLGEYIEVGESKGRVEKISTRALFLRHHRGALNVLPYGEIKRLRNTSRDWIILVLEFKLALDTDMKKVKKLVKAVGEEIASDPDVGPSLLEPLKSQGVLSTDESSVTVRVKYMSKPGNAPFVIRRLAYEKILKAFRENGIEFASKRVAVYVPPDAGTDRRAIAGAAAQQVIEAAAQPPKSGDGR